MSDTGREWIAELLAKAQPVDPETRAELEPFDLDAAREVANGSKPYRQPKQSSAAERESYRRELALGAEEIEAPDASPALRWEEIPSDDELLARKLEEAAELARSVAGDQPRQGPKRRPAAPKMRGPTRTPPGRPPRPPRPLTAKAERRRRLEERLRREGAPDCSPRDLSDQAFARVRTILRGTAKQAAKSLAELPRCYGVRVRRAALGIARRPEGGWSAPVRGLGHIRAREVIAGGVLLYTMGQATRRRGFARVVDGLSRGMLANAFVNPLAPDRTYSVQYLFGTSFRPGSEWWDCGVFVALARAGAITKVQPPADEVPRRYVGPTGYAFNEYWLSERSCSEAVPEDEREEPEAGSDDHAPATPHAAGPAPPAPG